MINSRKSIISLTRIVRDDLKMKTYNIQKDHGLTLAQKKAGVENVEISYLGTQKTK